MVNNLLTDALTIYGVKGDPRYAQKVKAFVEDEGMIYYGN